MANFTDYMEEVIIKWLRNDTPVSAPTALGLALFMGGSSIEANLEDGIVTDEVPTATTNYTRKVITLAAHSDGNTSNTAEIAWPAATTDWGTITHFGIVDDSSNLLMWGALSAAKTVNTNDVFKFGIGDILLSVQ
jgi:hypothetical protein